MANFTLHNNATFSGGKGEKRRWKIIFLVDQNNAKFGKYLKFKIENIYIYYDVLVLWLLVAVAGDV